MMKLLFLCLLISLLYVNGLSSNVVPSVLKRHQRTVVASPMGPGPSGTCGLEDCGTACVTPPMPTFQQLAVIPTLPDPFLLMNGTRITTKDQWICRRNEIRAQLLNYELGPKPGKPSVLTGTVTNTAITVTAGDGTNTITFTATIALPTVGTAPFPALIGIGGSSLNTRAIQAMGIALITFNNNDLAQQNSGASRGMGKFYTLYGSTHRAGAMIAWAWGVSRLIDILETTGAKLIDTTRLGVTGCSRNGKGALVVGAYDERIALTIPQESGSGGSASWRISDWQGTTVQTLGEITGENVWFTASLSQFNAAATKLPFDHHMLQGLVAPRGQLVIENTGMVWLGNQSCWGNSVAGHMTYEALQVPDSMGVSQIGNHNHCAFPASQEPEVEAFINKFLLMKQANTTIIKTDGGYRFDQAKWINWTVPILK